MKFTVVIPLFNKENYITSTIESVLSQRYQDFEIIVVDDGSTDDSYLKASQVAHKTDKLRIIKQKNQGVSVARNTGIYEAKGEFIAFLDADDRWLPDYLETINELITEFLEPDIFVTSYRVVLGAKNKKISSHISDQNCCLSSYWLTYKNPYDVVWTSATVIRKSAIIKAGMFTPGETIGQDLDLWSRVALINPKIGYSPKVCVEYNRSAEQNARTRIKIAYPKAYLNVLKETLQNSNLSDEEKRWIHNKYNKKMIVYTYTSILSGQQIMARRIISEWKKQPSEVSPLLTSALYISSYFPNSINKFIYKIRLKVF